MTASLLDVGIVRFSCGARPAMLVAISCPLEVASNCIWLPKPAASDSGMETSCWVPLPVETGMRRCWMGIVEGDASPAWLAMRNCGATCGWPRSCWCVLESVGEKTLPGNQSISQSINQSINLNFGITLPQHMVHVGEEKLPGNK